MWIQSPKRYSHYLHFLYPFSCISFISDLDLTIHISCYTYKYPTLYYAPHLLPFSHNTLSFLFNLYFNFSVQPSLILSSYIFLNNYNNNSIFIFPRELFWLCLFLWWWWLLWFPPSGALEVVKRMFKREIHPTGAFDPIFDFAAQAANNSVTLHCVQAYVAVAALRKFSLSLFQFIL